MHSDIVVLGQIGLLAAALVALVVWQWYEYQAAKRIAVCRTGASCSTTETPIVSPKPPAFTPDSRCRLRDLGVKPGVIPCGPNNAITDAGVLVGHRTVVEGDTVRTGVTVVIPHAGDIWNMRPSAGHFVLNGNGTLTGLDWIQESGMLEGPIALTNTHSVGDVYNGLLRWMMDKQPNIGITDDTYLPVVGECDDSPLNDIRGFHVRPEHAIEALNTASSGAVSEGSVGAGTGMTCYEFKGGIGTSSRVVSIGDKSYTVGVLVNCNHGGRDQLKMLGVNVGQILDAEHATKHIEGSIVIIVATDAPLSSRQLNRVAKRAALGMALTGGTGNDASGDFVIAFSNGRLVPRSQELTMHTLTELADGSITPIFLATIEATEEAILNCLTAADTVVGRDGNVSPALPLDRVRQLLND